MSFAVKLMQPEPPVTLPFIFQGAAQRSTQMAQTMGKFQTPLSLWFPICIAGIIGTPVFMVVFRLHALMHVTHSVLRLSDVC